MVKRLSMFVMRAKLKISDASALYDIRGLLGETALLACPALKEAAPWQARQEGETYFVKLHNALNAGTELHRFIWLGLKGEVSSAAFLNTSTPTSPMKHGSLQKCCQVSAWFKRQPPRLLCRKC